MMTEEEQRDFETFTLASLIAHRGKTSWKASQENTNFYSQAQQARHRSESLASQARSLGSVDQGQGQAQPLLDQAQAPAQVQPAGQDQFPVVLPQGQGRTLPVLARRGDLDSLFEDEREVMGMRPPAYNAPARKLIELSLPWHSSTIPIADRNHSIFLGRLNKYMKDQHLAKP